MVESPAALGTLLLIVAALQFVPGRRATAADRLHDAFWAARCPDAAQMVLDAEGVAALNRRLLATDRSVRDLAALPDSLAGRDVAEMVGGLSRLPDAAIVHDDGRPVTDADRERWQDALAVERIPDRVTPRFAVVTRRTKLRRFPTAEKIHRDGGPSDIDLFQESAFFPGTPVAAVHATRDGDWTFVAGPTYAAWVETVALAFAPRDTVLDFARRSTRVVIAARATAQPVADDCGEATNVALDMGTALPPPRGDASAAAGGGPSASLGLVDLPVRTGEGSLAVVVARVAPAAGMHDGPLPASRRNLLAQAFRFRGERYGWGHDHDARDCSGFVAEVYRSLGILVPRNTRDQAVSPAFDRTVVAADWPRDRRLTAIGALLPGDLVYAPRHVMMIVGHDDAGPWVIHDTHAGRLAGDPPPAPATGVVVAPLARILADDGGPIVDTVTTLVRILPSAPGDRP